MPLWLARTESIYAERLGATSFLGDVSGETGGGGSLPFTGMVGWRWAAGERWVLPRWCLGEDCEEHFFVFFAFVFVKRG